MKIYWFEKDIPALQGLSPQEKVAAKRAVMSQVWSHWQVWLPFAVQMVGFALFLCFAPRVPLPYMLLGIFLTSRIAALPYFHFLDRHLSAATLPPREET